MFNPPYFIDKITDANGKVIYEHTPTPTRVMSEQTAREETVALQAVVTGGTGTKAQLPDGRPAAGKTGTTDEHGDAWFIGFTPQLATAVWMGSPESVVPMQNVGGINVFGGTFPALVWHNFMAQAMDGHPDPGFAPPGPTPPPKFLAMPSRISSRPVLRVGGSRTTSPPRPAVPTVPPPSPAATPAGGGNGNGRRQRERRRRRGRAMTAAALDALLEVQALDTAADQLRHRREHLPERAELADRNAKLSELEARASELQARARRHRGSEKRLEDEIALVTEKAKSERTDRLYSGHGQRPAGADRAPGRDRVACSGANGNSKTRSSS